MASSSCKFLPKNAHRTAAAYEVVNVSLVTNNTTPSTDNAKWIEINWPTLAITPFKDAHGEEGGC
jgi:hypothetical protein